ncbi:MAG: hypothetical protein M3521_08040, partial [Acidobacteriota bacterium]|nr:hypothetical protein [Acidobacteriota bacterium]
ESVLIGFRFNTATFVRVVLVVLTIFDLPRPTVGVLFLVCPKLAQAKTSSINADKTNDFFILI